MSINDLLEDERIIPMFIIGMFIVTVIMVIAILIGKRNYEKRIQRGEFIVENNVKIIEKSIVPNPINRKIMLNMVNFELSNGRRIALAVHDANTYYTMVEGDCGTLKYYDNKFFGFERNSQTFQTSVVERSNTPYQMMAIEREYIPSQTAVYKNDVLKKESNQTSKRFIKAISIFILICAIVIFIAWASNSGEDTTSSYALCVKCGNTATSTLSGPADIMQKNGISLSDCTAVGGTSIYSASVCDNCVGPMAELDPDPWG